MKIVQINSYNHGSTGSIMLGIARTARENGMECVTTCPDGRSMRGRNLTDHMFIGTRLGRNLHIKLAEISGQNGCFSLLDTRRFLKKLDELKPDVVHLHNLHNCYINLPMLFRYLKKRGIRVIWTLHDCWAFTGKCPHFQLVQCERWKTGCYRCPQLRSYPTAYVDTAKSLWRRKKKWFTSLDGLTIVTPSHWLAGLVKQSFLGNYPVKVIHNGIDLNVFSTTDSGFRKKCGLEGKKILLGVAFAWEERKGLDVFIELARRLDESYQIVLVGTNEEVDRLLPSNILSIHRTHDQRELAGIYSVADVFVNPTREDTFPTVNLEALACGTPVVTFETGGSPECVDDRSGSVVPCDDVDALEREIVRICAESPFTAEACKARGALFDRKECFSRYIALYRG